MRAPVRVAATNFSGQLSANASVNEGTKLTIRETSLASGTAAPASSKNRTM